MQIATQKECISKKAEEISKREDYLVPIDSLAWID